MSYYRNRMPTLDKYRESSVVEKDDNHKTSSSTHKRYMTFDQLNNSATTTTTSSFKQKSSDLSQKIRQQIIKSDEEPSPLHRRALAEGSRRKHRRDPPENTFFPAAESTTTTTTTTTAKLTRKEVSTPAMQKALQAVRSPKNTSSYTDVFSRLPTANNSANKASVVATSVLQPVVERTLTPLQSSFQKTAEFSSKVSHEKVRGDKIVDKVTNDKATDKAADKVVDKTADKTTTDKKNTKKVDTKVSKKAEKSVHKAKVEKKTSALKTKPVDRSTRNKRSQDYSISDLKSSAFTSMFPATTDIKSQAPEVNVVTPLTKPPNKPPTIETTHTPFTRSVTKSLNLPSKSTTTGKSKSSTMNDELEGRDEVSTRRNLDKRTARLLHSQDFAAEITKYTATSTPKASETTTTNTTCPAGVSVYCRKRPLLEQEVQKGDFDVVRVQPGGTVTLFRTKMEADMNTKTIQPVEYQCTSAFGEVISSETVYRRSVQSLVNLAVDGGKATVLMFGQTGSGKTYTMEAIERLAFSQIFAKGRMKDIVVQVQYLELCGKACKDLVVSSENASLVKLRDVADGSVRFVNAASITVDGSEQLQKIVNAAKSRRATEATQKNSVSSRSHSLCQISMTHDDGRRGVLTLVDCAGTERKNDSMYHTKERQTESTEINASLYALKECLRARSNKSITHVPYRSSLLTRILRESLENERSHLAIIATVAPNATDFEHTMQTLNTVTGLMGNEGEAKEQQKVTPLRAQESIPSAPKSWTHDELCQWMVDKRLAGNKSVSDTVNGRAVMRMSKVQLRHSFYDDYPTAKGEEMADKLFKLIRCENERIGRLELKRRMANKSIPIRW